MPRPLDVDQRKADIARIAFDILGRGGPSSLTIHAVAEQLGGSVTKVTHIYPTRADLMRGTVDQAISDQSQLLASAPASSDEVEQHLRAQLLSMVPVDDQQRRLERGRVALITDKDQESAQEFIRGMEKYARQRLTALLRPLPEEQIETAVDFCRAFVNGVALSAVELPDYWTLEKITAIVDVAVNAVTNLSDLALTGTTQRV